MKSQTSAFNPMLPEPTPKDWRSLRRVAEEEGLFDGQTLVWLAILLVGGIVLLAV